MLKHITHKNTTPHKCTHGHTHIFVCFFLGFYNSFNHNFHHTLSVDNKLQNLSLGCGIIKVDYTVQKNFHECSCVVHGGSVFASFLQCWLVTGLHMVSFCSNFFLSHSLVVKNDFLSLFLECYKVL